MYLVVEKKKHNKIEKYILRYMYPSGKSGSIVMKNKYFYVSRPHIIII